MKKVFAIIATVAVLAACAKEIAPEQQTPSAENDSSTPEETTGKVMSLFAEIPALVDGNDSDSAVPASVDVKATATGTFSWTAGDKIAIPIEGGYAQFEYSAERERFEYTLTGNEKFINGTAYYPASTVVGGYSTDFNQTTNLASAGFKMEAEYTLGCSHLSFTHKSSLIRLNFTNVPSFATSVRVKIGDVVAATVALPTNHGTTFTVDVPVSPASGNATYSFALLENSNVLREVSKTVSLSAGKYYSTPDITIGNPIMVENNTDWGSLDIYCYSATDSWTNAKWGQSLATVKTITLGNKTYSYIIAKSSNDTYSFVFRKANADYPRVEHKGIAVSGETKINLTTTAGARVEGDTSPRLFIYNENKQAPVYIHYWGDGINGTTWGSDTEGTRQMIYMQDGHMVMSSKCTGLVCTGSSQSDGQWYFYYDFEGLGEAKKISFRLHQSENMGSQFEGVSLSALMRYGWWNNNYGGSWDAGAYAM